MAARLSTGGGKVGSRLKAKVYGIVQGVGYRAFVCRHARALGVKGYVRNLYDGSVEVVAEGPEEILRFFLKALRTGPLRARIEEVQVEWQNAEGSFTGFEPRW
jgi:acylphosphatase